MNTGEALKTIVPSLVLLLIVSISKKIKFSFKINKVCANKIEDKKIHQTTPRMRENPTKRVGFSANCLLVPVMLKLYHGHREGIFAYARLLGEIFCDLNEKNMDFEKQPEISKENIEYDFESGIKEVMEKIEQLLSNKDIIVVSISGPLPNDTNVGKTTLSSKIAIELHQRNIPFVLTSDSFMVTKDHEKLLRINQTNLSSDKAVIILGAQGSLPGTADAKMVQNFKNQQDNDLKLHTKDTDLHIDKIDIRILIYRPDRKPPSVSGPNAFADIVIRNDYANDK
jgi:hypothetical protein